jgi:hypothetical protein
MASPYIHLLTLLDWLRCPASTERTERGIPRRHWCSRWRWHWGQHSDQWAKLRWTR